MATVATLVDSSVWIDYFNGTPSAEADLLDGLIGRERLVVGDLILAEVLQGFRREQDFVAAREALLSFQPVAMLSPALAVASAQHFRALRQRGVTVRKTIDCLIATYCIENGVALLHSDRDFGPFELHLGLEVRRG